ncbi:MAG: prepilin peptidase [Verrucomicrobiales bacterium]|nr:prepilin peptidase [Verrucomicrobiales bacterium]
METLIPFLAIISFIIGASIGSFLNVVIYRLPRGISVNKPRRSFCPTCNYKIPFYLNIPIISWLILLGKCRNCSSKVSIRYLLVELISGVLFLACWLIYASPLSGQFQVTYYLVLPGWFLISLLISASLIDYEHQIIPDALNVIGLISGLIFAIMFPLIPFNIMGVDSFFNSDEITWYKSFIISLLSGAFGFLIIYSIVFLGKIVFGIKVLSKNKSNEWSIVEGEENPVLLFDDQEINFEDLFFVGTEKLVFECQKFDLNGNEIITDKVSVFYDRIDYNNESIEISDWVSVGGKSVKITYHREAMGFGDVKYMAMIGVFIGWKGILFTLFTASIIGTVVSLPGKILKSDNALNRIPFGPFLSLGAIIWLFYGPQLLDWYINLISMGNP